MLFNRELKPMFLSSIFVCVQPDSTTLLGVALSPSHTSRAQHSSTQGQARDRDSRAALRNPQDKMHIQQTYSGRSARVATRPENQAALPHIQFSETIVTSQPWLGWQAVAPSFFRAYKKVLYSSWTYSDDERINRSLSEMRNPSWDPQTKRPIKARVSWVVFAFMFVDCWH